MHDLLRERPRVPRRDDHRRAGHGGAAPGGRPGGRRDRRAPGRRRPAAVRPPTGPAQRPDRGGGGRGGGARAVRPPSSATAAGWRPCGRGSRAATGPDLDVVGGADHRVAARGRRAIADPLVRDADGASRRRRLAAGTRILAVMPSPGRPHAGRHVRSSRRARARAADPVRLGRRDRHLAPTDDEIAGVRARAGSSMPSWSGRSRRIGGRHRPRSSRRWPRPGPPAVTVALRTPWDAPLPGRRPTSRTYSILPDRSTRSPRPRRRDPASPAGSRSRSRRVPAMTLRDEIHEQPEVVARLIADRPSRRGDRRGASRGRAAPRRDRRARHVRPRRDLRAVPARCPASAAGRPRDAVDPVGLRRERRLADTLVIGISQSGASPDIVGVIEAAARQGVPTIAITNDPTRRWRPPPTRRSTSAPARSGRSRRPRRTPPSCWRSRCCRRRWPTTRPTVRRSPPSRATLARGARRSSPRSSAIAADQAARDPGAASSSAAASSTRRRASGHSSSRSSPTSSPTRTPRPTSSTVRWRSSSRVPGPRGRPSGRPGADLVALLGRLRDELGAETDGRLGRARGSGPRDLAGPPARRHARVPRADRLDRRRASSTRSTRPARAASTRSTRGTSARSRARRRVRARARRETAERPPRQSRCAPDVGRGADLGRGRLIRPRASTTQLFAGHGARTEEVRDRHHVDPTGRGTSRARRARSRRMCVI